MMRTAMPVDYEAKLTRQAPRWFEWIGWRTLVGGYVIILALLVVLGLIMPRLDAVYRDFNVRLPLVTRVMLELSHWVRQGGWTALLALPALLSVIVGAIGVLRRRPNRPSQSQRFMGWWTAMLIVGLALMGLAAITVFACYLPMFSLIESVSAP